MKKDDKLERAFDEYFEGLELPEGLAEDAKKLNIKRKPLISRLTKYASALACALIVCIVAAVGIHSGINNVADDDDYGGSSGNSGAADDLSESDGSALLYSDTYSLSGLETSEFDAYTISQTNSALGIIEKFALASNANVTSCTGYSDGGELMLVKAEVTVISTYNQQTEIYVEFTEDGCVCEDLTYYYGGANYAYGNVSYLYCETEDNGEPVRCITAEVNGVKYYIRVTSADTQAYLYYLELLNNM